jgi:hypothetical protein
VGRPVQLSMQKKKEEAKQKHVFNYPFILGHGRVMIF